MKVESYHAGTQLMLSLPSEEGEESLAGYNRRKRGGLSLAARQFYSSHLRSIFFSCAGNEFEEKIAQILARVYDDFYDPDPYGNEGDWGCDGVANAGRTLFACYGTTTGTRESGYIRKKVRDDFSRALEQWSDMREWFFITNAKVSADFLSRTWNPLAKEHGKDSKRYVKMKILQLDDMEQILLSLPEEDLEYLYPGFAEAEDFELQDLIKVIDALVANVSPADDDLDEVKSVSPLKLQYNKLSQEDELMLQQGMGLSGRIERYFSEQPDIELRDKVAKRLHASWEELCGLGGESSDVLHGLFARIGGKDFWTSGRERRMSTYAVAAFFFQTCDIFEDAPKGWTGDDGSCAS